MILIESDLTIPSLDPRKAKQQLSTLVLLRERHSSASPEDLRELDYYIEAAEVWIKRLGDERGTFL